MTAKIVRKQGEDDSGSKYNEFGIFSKSTMIPKSQEGEVKRIKMMLADLFAMSQKNGGFVLIMAKDGKGNVRSAMTMNSVSSAEGLAFAIDAEFKMKALIKSVAEQAMSGGINELMKQMDDTRKAEDKSVG